MNEYSKSKKDEYDSDEDESNSLVIEEENDQTQTEESNVKNDESGIQKNNVSLICIIASFQFIFFSYFSS